MTYVSLRDGVANFDDIVGQGHVEDPEECGVDGAHFMPIFFRPAGNRQDLYCKGACARSTVKRPTPDPYGRSCVAIRDGNAMDVIEIDAASNRGIEEIRDLREKVPYAPTRAAQVYIDEAIC